MVQVGIVSALIFGVAMTSLLQPSEALHLELDSALFSLSSAVLGLAVLLGLASTLESVM